MSESVFKALEASAESALMAYGERTQLIKTCEECSELIAELARRVNNFPTTSEAIIDEIADCLIMLYQMRSNFGVEEVDERVLFKLNRTMSAIRNQKKIAPEGNA